jgi:hypothetical protein
MDREKANELWEQRGCRKDHDLEDWFDAEAIVMEARRELSHVSGIEQIQIVQLDTISQACDTRERVSQGDNPMRSSSKAMFVVDGGVAGADCGQDTSWCKRTNRR